MTPSKLLWLLLPLIFSAACDSSTDVDALPRIFLLSAVDGKPVPAQLINVQHEHGTSTATVLRGAIEFVSADSALYSLHTYYEARGIDSSNVTSQEICQSLMVAYRQTRDRIHLDFEQAALPPSVGFGAPAIMVHDTLYRSSAKLFGRQQLEFVPDALKDRVVSVEYVAARSASFACN